MFFLKINFSKIGRALKLFRQAYGKYHWQIIVITVLGFISGIASAVGISILIPLFSLLAKGDTSATDSISRLIQRTFIFLHLSYTLHYLLFFMFLLITAKALFLFWANYYTVRITNGYLEDRRNLLMNLTLGASWPFLINQKVGYLDRIMIDDTTYGASIFRHLSEMFLRLTNLIAYAIIAVKISFSITLISLITGTAVFFLTKPLFYRLHKISQNLNIISKNAAHFINENMIGMKTIKTASVQKEVIKQGGSFFNSLKQGQLKFEYFNYIQTSIFEPATFLFIAIILIYYYRIPSFNIVSFAVVMYLIEKIYLSIQNIQSRAHTINISLPYLDMMINYQLAAEQNQEKPLDNRPFKFKTNLSVENVSLKYPNQEKPALAGVSFEIKKGEMVGIIGPSGAGKTTLVDVLLRLLKPVNGEIKLDGITIDNFSLAQWRKNIGYVSQDVFLFNDTLGANVRFYNPTVTPAAVIAATKAANIFDFIQSLPDKFETMVGERGLKLSGGQRQRIALARVLAREPEVLILDEATSFLDSESETLIQKAITGLKGKITVIIIAHRLSTVMNSDRLIALENGTVIEIGSPEELMKKSNSYLHKSYQLQDL